MEQKLKQFGEFLHKKNIVPPRQIPFMIGWTKKFLSYCNQFSGRKISLQKIHFEEHLSKCGHYKDWQVLQAANAVSIFYEQFLADEESFEIEQSRMIIDELNEKNVLYGLQEAIRLRHLSLSTERAYLAWSRRFLTYCKTDLNTTYPTSKDVKNFLSHLALHQNVSASTQNQAFCALLMLCKEVLQIDVGDISQSVRAKKSTKLPVVLSSNEVSSIFSELPKEHLLICQLLYGSGMRLTEAIRLRVKDIDFDLHTITVRDGKGKKDRTTLLPESLLEPLKFQMKKTKEVHTTDIHNNYGEVFMPYALARKYPNAAKQWQWQWVFPQKQLSIDPRSCSTRRHHLHPKKLQRAFAAAVKQANIYKHASVHSLRHSFATQLLINNVDIRQIQDLLGHKSLETTMIYTHVARGIRAPCQSPVDTLEFDDV